MCLKMRINRREFEPWMYSQLIYQLLFDKIYAKQFTKYNIAEGI